MIVPVESTLSHYGYIMPMHVCINTLIKFAFFAFLMISNISEKNTETYNY